MNKHTPGPWHVEDDGFGHLSVRSGNARDIGRGTVLYIASEVGGLRRGPNFEDRSEQQANARLIAAAPTMYDFVQLSADHGDYNAKAILEAIHGRS